MKIEIKELGTKHATKQYTVIWAFRFIEQFILSTLRWFTWCDCVFPYVPRWDIWSYGIFLTLVCMWVVNHKRPQRILKFNEGFEDYHMPAPCEDTAKHCNLCRERHFSVDVEQGSEYNYGFTLYEATADNTIL
jgi:hypothetical protein